MPVHKGYRQTEEHKIKISEGLKLAHRLGKMPSKRGICLNTGRTHFKKGNPQPENANKFKKGHPNYNLKCSEATKEKMRGRIPWNKGEKLPNMSGENHWNWKGGVENHEKKNERNDPAYQKWVRLVKKRDKNQCIFKGQNCSGYNIVHHILSWQQYPELRYNIKNGITLCQAHHPRKRAEEKRLIPMFQELVSVSNGLI